MHVEHEMPSLHKSARRPVLRREPLEEKNPPHHQKIPVVLKYATKRVLVSADLGMAPVHASQCKQVCFCSSVEAATSAAGNCFILESNDFTTNAAAVVGRSFQVCLSRQAQVHGKPKAVSCQEPSVIHKADQVLRLMLSTALILANLPPKYPTSAPRLQVLHVHFSANLHAAFLGTFRAQKPFQF